MAERAEAERSDARNKLLRMTAERDAALAEVERLRELRQALVDVLAFFTELSPPFFAISPMLRTRWVTVDRVTEWRKLAGNTTAEGN